MPGNGSCRLMVRSRYEWGCLHIDEIEAEIKAEVEMTRSAGVCVYRSGTQSVLSEWRDCAVARRCLWEAAVERGCNCCGW
jgi:hypothetical protein